MTDIIVKADLRLEFGPVRDQGNRPTCLAFAASDAHAGLRAGWVPLSCEYAFYHAQRRNGRRPNQGAQLPSMMAALREDGQPMESGWPYLLASPADAASWGPPRAVGPLFGRASLSVAASFDQVLLEIDQRRPVLILLTLSPAFFAPAAKAVIHPATGEVPEPARRHAVVAVGHGFVDWHRAILVRNSWGEKWGEAGHGWLTEAYLGPRIFGAAQLTEEVDVSAGTVAA